MIFLTQLLWIWAYGLLSVFLIVLAVLLLYRVLRKRKRPVRIVRRDDRHDRDRVAVVTTVPDWRQAIRNPLFIIALLLFCWSFFGRHLALALRPSGDALEPVTGRSANTINGPDGTRLHVESVGPTDGPVLIFTHGWSLDARVWNYAKRDLPARFRVVAWDLPGLSRSTEPETRNYSLDKMAENLDAVIRSVGKPAVLVGHSIGGMINLTYCRNHSDQLEKNVLGLVQVDTTYTNPVKTTSSSGFDMAMQKPLYEPLLHLTIGLSPLVRAMNWMSYQNGFMYLTTASSSFAGAETREQLDYAARRNYEASPAVLARGMLAMLHWDATPVLAQIRVRTLILEGEQDKTTIPEASRYMRDTIPAADMKTVNKAAHLGLLEQNRAYNEAIRHLRVRVFS